MSTYKNAKIYVLKNNINDMVYIGHTINKLKIRKKNHKKMSNHFNITINSKRAQKYLYDYINRLGWDNWDMKLLERYPCKNLEEITKRERYWVEKEMDKNLGNVLNKEIPYRAPKENDKLRNKKTRKEINKKYYQKIKSKHSNDCKDYYKNNKKEVLAKQKQSKSKPYYCNYCNKNMKRGSKSSHNKSKTHISNVKKFENNLSNILENKLSL